MPSVLPLFTGQVSFYINSNWGGWLGGRWGEGAAGRACMCIQPIHLAVQQRVTHQCEAAVPRLRDSSAQAGSQTN